jgi:hypothetical protein
MIEYASDFETTTDANDCRVWAWGCAEVGAEPEDSYVYGNDFAGWLSHVMENPGRYWFHNLGFDSRFVMWNLLHMGFTWVPKKPKEGEFSSVIDNMGKIYALEIGNANGRLQLADSYKKFPMSLASVARAYDLPMSKGELDYDAYREVGHELTEEEKDYLSRDVLILARAMHKRLQVGTKLTTGADCLATYQDIIGDVKWKIWFPHLNPKLDGEIRQAYRGGYVYCNPIHQGQVVGEGIALDVNSLYPYVMRTALLPWGTPKRFKGRPRESEEYPLWVCSVRFDAAIKPGKLPCIQMKNNMFYGDREYIRETVEPIELSVSSVDWKLICDMYEVTVYEWGGGYAFHASHGMFDDYIDHWVQEKIVASKDGNQARRQNAKLALNNLYGKFGQKVDVQGKVPFLDSEEVLRFIDGDEDMREPVYIPGAVFITAWARDKTIRTACEFGDRYLYSDTDSIKALGADIPEDVHVDDYELGAWALEGRFDKGVFLRAKTYATVTDGVPTYVCAGMPNSLKDVMMFEDFRLGFTTLGTDNPDYANQDNWKLVPKNVRGGCVLVPLPFTIHG